MSYSSVLVLGLIAEKPINPYEIKKLLEKINIKKWLPTSSSSIYASIRKLHKMQFISGEVLKEGNMPEKTVYSVTEKGRKVLYETLVKYLESTELDNKKYHISCLMICHLTKEEAIEILTKKQIKLGKVEFTLGKIIEGFEHDNRIPYTGLSIIRHESYMVHAELTSVKELLAAINKDTRWNYSITRDLGTF